MEYAICLKGTDALLVRANSIDGILSAVNDAPVCVLTSEPLDLFCRDWQVLNPDSPFQHGYVPMTYQHAWNAMMADPGVTADDPVLNAVNAFVA